MKTLVSNLADHLEGEVTSICTCWKIIRTDGSILGFTDHDNDLILNNQHYECSSGFISTTAETALGLKVNSEEISGALKSDKIKISDIRANVYDGARVEIYLVNWKNPNEHLLQRVCVIGEITEEDGLFRAELRGLTSYLDQTFGRVFSTSCDASLGDKRCGFNLNNPKFSVNGTVTKVLSNLQICASGISSFKSGWFNNGFINWHSGNNTDNKQTIANCRYDSERTMTIIGLWEPMSKTVMVGDQFTLIAGCDKTFSTCQKKFSNQVNFRGFPHIPGQDTILSYAKRNNINDGGPIVT